MGESLFPRRLFNWFIRQQVLVAGGVLLALDLALLFWLSRLGLGEEARSVSRQVVILTLFLSGLVWILVSWLMARRLVGPLGRLITKTERLVRYPFADEVEDVDALTFDEPGEWFDLERALNELGKGLREKTIRLSREKTELRAIMSAMDEGVLAVDRAQKVLFFNSPMALHFGDGTNGLAHKSLVEILRAPEVVEAYSQCLATGESRGLMTRLDSKTGVGRDLNISVTPLRKRHNQEIYGAVGVFHDITELKKAERIRIEFVGNVSHELRTPLTAIKGYLQTVLVELQAGQTEESLSFLKIVDRNVDRLQNLVNDLLELSSLQSGVKLERKPVDLAHLTEGVLSQVDHRGHVVRTRILAREMLGDAHRLEQVLRNLLQNAVRYVPAGGEIEVVWEENPDGGGVRLRVKDNGPGIAPEHLPRLFERFYRVDEARSRQVGGTGIGLALVKHIVQGHGGDVQVFSQLGQGAEFICSFPASSIRPVEISR